MDARRGRQGTSTGLVAAGVDASDYYSISRTAALLGVSRVTIWRWIRDGRLPVTRLGHRTVHVQRDDLERFIAEGGMAASLTRKARSAPPEHAGSEQAAPWIDWSMMDATEHFVQFYETDSVLLDAVAGFIGAALRAGEAGVVFATSANLASLEARLREQGFDLAAARASDRYLPLSAAATLERLMLGEQPDPDRFTAIVDETISRAAVGGRPVRVFGEMVALLVGAGNPAAALRLEELWNAARQRLQFSLFCAYPLPMLADESLANVLGDVCAEHSRVIPAESYLALPSSDDRLRAIAHLQQKASRLEAEIAERRRVEERLRVALAAEQAARQEAEMALRQRHEFLSIAAHELKTPLTTLSAHAQMSLRQLQRHGHLERERVEQALMTITGQAGKLSRLLNQLLDITRIEDGKLPLERQPTDLASIVEQVVASAHLRGDHHAVTVNRPETLLAHVDPIRLEQVLTNLLDNAMKYSPDGGAIEVALRLVGQREVEISVRDHGLGIPVEKRDQIFERFYQAHDSGHRSGLGLGLYISRQIVELHGGQIRAEFPPNGGSCFIVRLPVETAPPLAASAD